MAGEQELSGHFAAGLLIIIYSLAVCSLNSNLTGFLLPHRRAIRRVSTSGLQAEQRIEQRR
jgi:hypothetical protein